MACLAPTLIRLQSYRKSRLAFLSPEIGAQSAVKSAKLDAARAWRRSVSSK